MYKREKAKNYVQWAKKEVLLNECVHFAVGSKAITAAKAYLTKKEENLTCP